MITKSYFTFADKLSQDRMIERSNNERKNRVLRNLKASLLLNDKVVFRAYAAIESDITESIYRENFFLLEKGYLIPEIRKNDNKLLDQVNSVIAERPSKTNKLLHSKMEFAERIDSLSLKEEVDGDKLSKARSNCLALLLLRLAISPNDYLQSNVTAEDLIPIYNKLYNQGIPPRKLYLEDIKKLFKKQTYAINLIQSIYFGIGAHFTASNPIWTTEINPHKEGNLGIWLSSLPKLEKIDKTFRKLSDDYGLTEHLEANQTDIDYLKEILPLNMKADNIINTLNVDFDDLDSISFHDIIVFKKSSTYKNMGTHLSINKDKIDFGIDRVRVDMQTEQAERRLNKMKKIELTTEMLGFLPIIGTFFHLSAIAMNLFSKQAEKILTNNLPLYSYSEMIKRKARENRIVKLEK